MRNSITTALIAVAISSAPLTAHAQEVRVAVQVTDGETGGIFSSAFRSAVRSLPGALVVAADDSPDVILTVVVVCDRDDCATSASYAVALLSTVPLERSPIRVALRLSRVPAERIPAATDSVYRHLREYQRRGGLQVAHWGRNRYEAEILRYVRELDTSCFEKFRILSKPQDLTASEWRLLSDTKWQC